MDNHPQTTLTFGPGASRPKPWSVLAWSAALVGLDFALGPDYAVSVFFVLPVISAAWYQGFRFACGLAISLAVLRFACHWAWGFPVHFNAALVNNILRGLTLVLVAFITEQLAAQMRALKKRQNRLESNLPVCPSCGLACHADGQWMPLDEQPLSKTTPPGSLCPECERRAYDVQPG